MARRALLILVASLLAVTGSDVAAWCVSNQVAEAKCCCPVDGPPPCLSDDQGSAEAMPDSDAVIETASSLQAAELPSATAPMAPWPATTRPAVVDRDAGSSVALSPRLLACVWLC